MQYVLIIHEVETYTAWKAVFDQAAGIRKQAGEISYQLRGLHWKMPGASSSRQSWWKSGGKQA
jgi:hypothetical protein